MKVFLELAASAFQRCVAKPGCTAIERSRAIRAESEMLRDQQMFLRGQVASLRDQVVTAGIESQRILAKRQHSETARVSIPCVLRVDDHARWRDAICAMLKDGADCGDRRGGAWNRSRPEGG